MIEQDERDLQKMTIVTDEAAKCLAVLLKDRPKVFEQILANSYFDGDIRVGILRPIKSSDSNSLANSIALEYHGNIIDLARRRDETTQQCEARIDEFFTGTFPRRREFSEVFDKRGN